MLCCVVLCCVVCCVVGGPVPVTDDGSKDTAAAMRVRVICNHPEWQICCARQISHGFTFCRIHGYACLCAIPMVVVCQRMGLMAHVSGHVVVLSPTLRTKAHRQVHRFANHLCPNLRVEQNGPRLMGPPFMNWLVTLFMAQCLPVVSQQPFCALKSYKRKGHHRF